jgi:hypothetical protein
MVGERHDGSSVEDAAAPPQLGPPRHAHGDTVALDFDDLDPEVRAKVFAPGRPTRLERSQVCLESRGVAIDGRTREVYR